MVLQNWYHLNNSYGNLHNYRMRMDTAVVLVLIDEWMDGFININRPKVLYLFFLSLIRILLFVFHLLIRCMNLF